MSNSSPVSGLLFDLDHCLYENPTCMISEWNLAFFRAAQELGSRLTMQECEELNQEASKYHGNSYDLFYERHGIARNRLLHAVGRHMREGMIRPCIRTAAGLARWAAYIPMAIVTSGGKDWASRVLSHIGLEVIFPDEKIVGLETSEYNQKSKSDLPFRIGADILGLPPERLLVVDDHLANLKTAHGFGAKTVHITHGIETERPSYVTYAVGKPYHIFDMIERGEIVYKNAARPTSQKQQTGPSAHRAYEPTPSL